MRFVNGDAVRTCDAAYIPAASPSLRRAAPSRPLESAARTRRTSRSPVTVRQIEAEVVASVPEAEVTHELAELGLVGGQEAAFCAARDEVAQDATEILMARDGQQALRAARRAREACEEAAARDCCELPPEACRGARERPGVAELELAGHGAVLKGAEERDERLDVRGVRGVDDRARQLVLAVERVEEARERGNLRFVTHGVEAATWAAELEQARALVAPQPEVELLDPAATVIEERELVQERRLIAPRFFARDGRARGG